jgi:DNA replication ATP-dependent helicase Dna2
MHEEIMDFPGKWFYENNLQVLNELTQKAVIQYKMPNQEPVLGYLIAQRRVVFLPVQSAAQQSAGQKTSAEEALLCVRMVLFFKQLWKTNKKKWEPEKSLGIITPWRAQIAQIRSALSEAGIDPNDITVDTVERYQGGARDVIILSTCAHSEWQLNALLNISNEGVDRKLNVALTRAREHLIMVGNKPVLQHDERYRRFIELYGVDDFG